MAFLPTSNGEHYVMLSAAIKAHSLLLNVPASSIESLQVAGALVSDELRKSIQLFQRALIV